MANQKYKDLIQYLSGDYAIDYPIGNQTFHMEFQLLDNEQIVPTTKYYNIWINLYNKRKDMSRNEDLHISTGLNPMQTVIVARNCFEALQEEVIQNMKIDKKDVVIYCHWVDNRRRDAYYKILSKYGYRYGNIPNETCKVIMKKFKWKDYKEM